ncbi:MAG: HAD family hydrolase [Thermoprotei archaeon]|jgi:HAD superfamily phosphoserine phosphatase-like hydrolase
MKGIVVFDVDGTLDYEKSSWRLLYDIYGAGSLSDDRFATFESGKIDYEALVGITLDDLKRLGLRREDVDRLSLRMRPRPEAAAVIRKLKNMGWEPIAVSAGVCNLTRRLLRSLGIDLAYCNYLEFDQSGALAGAKILVNPAKKDLIVYGILESLSLPKRAVVAVGDHAMDFSMFNESGHYLVLDGTSGSCDDGRGVHITSLSEVPYWIELWQKTESP